MIGSANSEWVPTAWAVSSNSGKVIQKLSSLYSNVGATNTYTYFESAGMAPSRGGLKLYCKGVRLKINLADGSNFVTQVRVHGIADTGRVQKFIDGTNRTASADLPFTAFDASIYDYISIDLSLTVATANLLKVLAPSLDLYYDT